MKTRNASPRADRSGYALLLVLVFGGIGLLALAGALDWTMTNGTLIHRENQHYKTLAAAEAATEKVLTRITSDFKNSGETYVYDHLSTYTALVPTSSENAAWAGFSFNNAAGGSGQTHVGRTVTQAYVSLESQYTGLSGFASTYRIVSNAREVGGRFSATDSAVQQDVQLASIPIFQFAIFYSGDMEFNGCSTLSIRGRVHGNANLYTGSGSTQTFYEDVTVSGIASNGVRYGWSTNGGGPVYLDGVPDQHHTALTLPIGTNNTAAAVREVIQMPPDGEDINSAMGRERYYNKAELVILVSNATVTVGVKTPFTSTLVPINSATNFICVTNLFTDKRENKTIMTTELDIVKYTSWAATNNEVSTTLGAGVTPNLIYVGDFRTETASKIAGVRLVNGKTLPPRGLTVATPNPLYTKGHYNQPTDAHLGTTNTVNTKPASLVSDAYTLLSASFDDSKSANTDPTTRVAVNTTVVAALVTGNVPSAAVYSGGVNNLPRLLEAWTGKTYTLNGSLVCLYNSAKATSVFQSPGVYYNAPSRNVNFDLNFTDPTKVPPGTPSLRTLVRAKWLNPPAGTTTYVGSQ